MKRRLIIAATLLTLAAASTGVQAQQVCRGIDTEQVEIARVIDGRSFLLADGREVRLAAIETLLPVPGDEDEARVEAARAAKTALETLLANRHLTLSVTGAGADRYGRLTAYAFVRTASGETLVQRELVATGHALVSPAPMAVACRIYLRSAEREARNGGRGLWGDPYRAVKYAADPADILAEQGRFAVVQGKVASVRESAGLVYINFGRRWREEFTATFLKRNEGIFAGADMTPKALAGRTIEVRGWIEERGGPAMEVTRPEQIEIVH